MADGPRLVGLLPLACVFWFQQEGGEPSAFRAIQALRTTPLPSYAHLTLPDDSTRVVGCTEASRGCKHLCRHCPIVPVYNGTFRIVQREVVLEDIRRQVAAGAQHITFGDPDFFNGVGHSMQIVEALHREHPGVSCDVTIKVEHLLKHAGHLPALRKTACAFVTTAVESVPFTPWTTLEGYEDLLATLIRLELVEHTSRRYSSPSDC